MEGPREERRRRLLFALPCADLLDSVEGVAARILKNMFMTIEAQARIFGPALLELVKSPLPFDSANPMKPALMLELLPSIRASLLDDTWHRLSTAFTTTPQSTPIVLLSGVSGVGKTKVAYDIGLFYAFVVMSRVVEHDAPTPPWQSFLLFAHEVVSAYAPALPPLLERISLKATIITLLAAHLEWAVSVTEADLSPVCSRELAAAEAALFGEASSEPNVLASRRERTLHELVLRAQRNGLAYRHVSCLFGAALRNLLSAENAIGATGTLQLSSHSALDYLLRVVARARTVWCRPDSACGEDAVPPRIVWAHDEAQGLLDVKTLPSEIFDGVFSGSFDEAGGSTGAGVRRGCFYGLLAAVREVTTVLQSGHLLLGTSLDMTGEILSMHSPAQGISDAVQVAENFDVPALRNWLQRLLSPAAFAGVTDEALELLRGRPLFASLFWTMLVAGCIRADDMTLVDRVKDALKCAYVSSTKSAATRISALWVRCMPVADGHVPSRLLRFLFHELIMATGKDADWRAMHLQVGVRECIQRGILNMSSDGGIVLDAEPATTCALREEGIKRVLDGNDGILSLLAGRVTESGGGEVDDYGPAQEACLRG